MEYKRIYKDGIHLVAGKIGTVVVGLLDMMLLARILTTEQMGKYSLFLMIVNLALILGLNWSDASIVRHGREEYIKREKINKSFWARMYLFVPIITIITIVFAIFHRQITDYIGISSSLIFFVIGMFVLNGILNFINYIHQSTDRMKKSAYVLLSQKIIFLVLIAMAFFNVFNTSLTLVFILINVSFLAAIIINLFFFDFNKIVPYSFDKAYFKRIWSYSWPQLIGFPGLYVINYIDLFVIKKYMDLGSVGVYSMAYQGFSFICGFIMILYTIFFPLIVEYKTKRKYKEITNYIKKIPQLSAMWLILVIAGIMASGFVIPLLFSAKYTGSVPSFNILLMASVFYFASVCLLPIVNAFDLIIYSQIFNLIKAAVNIAADFILVPKIGIIGAAYGTMISYSVGLGLSILLIYLNRKRILFGKSD